MNDDLLHDLSNPVFDLAEAEGIMRRAGAEIIRLENRIKQLTDCTHRLQSEVEKLSLDLGIKERGYFRQ